MDIESRIKAYRFVAYSAVTFSVVAVLSVCVTLPMVYNYVHHVRRQMHSEVVMAFIVLSSLSLSLIASRPTKRPAGLKRGKRGK